MSERFGAQAADHLLALTFDLDQSGQTQFLEVKRDLRRGFGVPKEGATHFTCSRSFGFRNASGLVKRPALGAAQKELDDPYPGRVSQCFEGLRSFGCIHVFIILK